MQKARYHVGERVRVHWQGRIWRPAVVMERYEVANDNEQPSWWNGDPATAPVKRTAYTVEFSDGGNGGRGADSRHQLFAETALAPALDG
jgi:hypothetical protein